MKKARILIRTLFGSAIMMLFLGTASCKKGEEKDTKETATDQNKEILDDNKDKQDDSKILVSAAETNLMEIEIGKLAQTKSTNAHVKEFGKMLEADHTKAMADLQALADKKQVSLPASITDKGKAHYNELNEKSGKDFDKKLGEMMVDGHEDAIKMFQNASEKANDPEVRTWAASMLATLQTHLEHAKMIRDENK